MGLSFRFGVPQRVKPCLCRSVQQKPSWQPSSAASFSTGSLPSVSRKQPAHGPCSLISITDASASRVRKFRTTARGYSSQAAEELESTPFIGDDDAAYLQRMITLGSSVSKASDLATLEALLAMPNISIAMKTIGAKIVVAALEQRQQWALLPALLPIAQFRRLVEDQNLGVGEQLFAALLRGQFVFARRHSGAAPDVYRTLDIAAKCNALHAPSVINAVRVGYQSLGLESPTRINELLDIGPADVASHQRLAQQQDDEGDDDDDDSFSPVGTARTRLTGGMFMRQITHARKTQPVYMVLPAVLAALPRVHDRDPDGRQRILGAVCGRDVYTVSEVQGLARALGIVPNMRVWSQVVVCAIHRSGPTDAAAIIQYVYDHVPDGYVGYHAVHLTMATLAGNDYLAVASREAVQLAWRLFELHRTKGGDRALDLRPDSRGTLTPLIAALMADINFPERKAAVEVLCRYTEAKKLLKHGEVGETWAKTMAQLAGLRCTSHLDALDAVLAEPGGPLEDVSLRGLFGALLRYRYANATTAPVAALLKVLAFTRDKGFAPDAYYCWTYIRSIYISLLRLHADMGLGLQPVICGAVSAETVPEQHMAQALASIREVDRLCQDFGLESDESILAALFLAYSAHNGAPKDCARLQSRVLANAIKMKDSHDSRAVIARLLGQAGTYEELNEAWKALSFRGLPPNVELRCSYASRLLQLSRFQMAIEFMRRNIPDDPSERAVVRFVARLLLSTEGSPFALAARDALPITTNDARTREAINKIINHRRGLGLKWMTTVSDI